MSRAIICDKCDLILPTDGSYEPRRETNYQRYFGTPERAAETLEQNCSSRKTCSFCSLYATGHPVCDGKAESFLVWLNSEVE